MSIEKKEQIDLQLKAIIVKNVNSEPLTKEEAKVMFDNLPRYNQLASEVLNKRFDGKTSFKKTVTFLTGDEVRKATSSPELKKPERTGSAAEAPLPKDRGFEGGYDSKADIAEREEATPDPSNTPEPTREENLSDHKEEKTPSEKTDGEPEGDYKEEEYADTDGKPYRPQYEEDRIADITEGKHNYKESVRIHDIVTKPVSKGVKMVGIVTKIYDGKEVVLVKWANGIYRHENLKDISILKSEKSERVKSTEDKKVSPPIKTDETDAKEISQVSPPVKKGEAPPSDWMEDCKAALARDNADVDNPFAVCTAAYQRMGKVAKDENGDSVVRISQEEMKEICPPCAEKMVAKRIKFLKFTISDVKKN